MNIPWGSEAAIKFANVVGLITSDGPNGPNIMAAEWTHHVSYEPALIMINTRETDATTQNILKTKEFGINLAAADQNWVASIAGGSHGQKVDKISVLKELGVEFYKGKKTGVLMVKGAALNIECKVVESEKMGDHMMFMGEAQDVTVGSKEPLIYHGLKYYKVGEKIEKPSQDFLDKIAKLVEKHKK